MAALDSLAQPSVIWHLGDEQAKTGHHALAVLSDLGGVARVVCLLSPRRVVPDHAALTARHASMSNMFHSPKRNVRRGETSDLRKRIGQEGVHWCRACI